MRSKSVQAVLRWTRRWLLWPVYIASPFGAFFYGLDVCGYSPFEDGFWHTLVLIFTIAFLIVHVGPPIFSLLGTGVIALGEIIFGIGAELTKLADISKKLKQHTRIRMLAFVLLAIIVGTAASASIVAMAPAGMAYTKKSWNVWHGFVRSLLIPETVVAPLQPTEQKFKSIEPRFFNELPNSRHIALFGPISGPSASFEETKKDQPVQAQNEAASRHTKMQTKRKIKVAKKEIRPDPAENPNMLRGFMPLKMIPCILVTLVPRPQTPDDCRVQ